ncbi:MAG: hypothetical protein ACHQXA_00160, partial [Gemmatimonadales bacterium]
MARDIGGPGTGSGECIVKVIHSLEGGGKRAGRRKKGEERKEKGGERREKRRREEREESSRAERGTCSVDTVA